MKLHLGCGGKFLHGYTHVDLAEYDHIDYRKPIFPLNFIPENSVEEIYCSHALEYFDFSDCVSVLNDWNSKLVSGGCLRLSVPDFDKLLRVYAKENGEIDRIIGPLFGRWKIPGEDKFVYHKTVFTKAKLVFLLDKTGFISINDWNPLEFFGDSSSDFDDYSKAFYPHMDFKNGFSISANLIAYK